MGLDKTMPNQLCIVNNRHVFEIVFEIDIDCSTELAGSNLV